MTDYNEGPSSEEMLQHIKKEKRYKEFLVAQIAADIDARGLARVLADIVQGRTYFPSRAR